ncbi:PH domain-containing protein [Aureobasidium namibiae CBS 147.97]|uniref:PH domain-containing protein n=1 Tax=Aureobasidium namibiae CBS 147.97 TaxID=1043004 RepID=A0A074WNA0_9PEZI|nr:PH domain-containing protein [Aureobasidium namibiae CBS 147.97]KEQ74575.1 PH domain-containing protein [Aureobasidium namibiae CBS 147.97]
MASTERALPTRTATNMTDDDAIPDEDTSEVTKLFHERLQAWKHACGYLEDYVSATEKMQHAHAKEYEKVLKTVSHPLKEGHHFDQNLGGVAGTFDTIRSNTQQGISNSHAETAKTLKGSVLPIFERLHTEIKNKTKELTKGAGKGGKLVDKARQTSQKHIEQLGQHTAAFESTGGKISAHEDPYVLQRGVYHRLNKQIIEENNNRNDIIAVQNSFAQFEAHILTTIQNGLTQFNQVVGIQAEQTRTMYGNMTSTATQVAPDFEWNGFVQRNNQVLIDPNAPPRSMSNISFPNQNHRSTEPLVAGSLEKKGKLLKKYEASFWVITPAKYMHEYKTDDDFAKDPVPETSLYLPDCMIGALDGQKFMVKGKDVSGSSFGNKLSMAHEYAFKAHTPQDAAKWYEALRGTSGSQTNELSSTSPATSRQPSAAMGPVSTEEPTKVFAEEDTRPQTTETAALDAEKREAAYAAAGPTDTVAHTRV